MNKYSAPLINALQMKYQINPHPLHEVFMWQLEINVWLWAHSLHAPPTDRYKNTNTLFQTLIYQ